MGLPGWKRDQIEEIILNVISTERSEIQKEVEIVNKIKPPMQLLEGPQLYAVHRRILVFYFLLSVA
jgi:hypothetical protein